MRSCSWVEPRRRRRAPCAPPSASSTRCRPDRRTPARPRGGPSPAEPPERVSAALLLRDGGLARLTQLGSVFAQAGGDPATTGLHVCAELRHVRLARLTRGLELLVDPLDASLALGGHLVRVLLHPGVDVGASLGIGTEAGHVRRTGTLRRRCGGRLLCERGTGAECGEEDEGCGREDGAMHRVELLGKQVAGFPHSSHRRDKDRSSRSLERLAAPVAWTSKFAGEVSGLQRPWASARRRPAPPKAAPRPASVHPAG